MPYHPPQRAVAARVLSVSRWIDATFHLPKLHAFDDHLRKDRQFFTLTEVALAPGTVLPFLALRASAALAIAPRVPEAELRLAPSVGTRARQVSCYVEHAAFHGRLELLPSVRTSDFLSHQDGFIALRTCRIVPSPFPGEEPLPVVFVNARAIIAVAEEGVHLDEDRAAPLPRADPVG